ncbi:ankyrin repeat domain-containing protein [Streptomyces sp. NPDC048448]|uniref:ankyrin repeat domain-containing protein n=1 Tax=Streptomyces sp. NPDC048448 TaxID=3365554 RepID=UPI00371273DC
MIIEIGSLWTPAHRAIESNDADELARLLDSGIDPNEECYGMTLLAHAVDYEADTAIQADRDMGVTLIAILLAYGASPQIPGSGGKTPMDFAADYQHVLAERLLSRFIL